MALLSYDMIKEIRSVAEEYAQIERKRQAEAVQSRRAEASANGQEGASRRRSQSPGR